MCECGYYSSSVCVRQKREEDGEVKIVNEEEVINSLFHCLLQVGEEFVNVGLRQESTCSRHHTNRLTKQHSMQYNYMPEKPVKNCTYYSFCVEH